MAAEEQERQSIRRELRQRLATAGERWLFVLRWVLFALACGAVLGFSAASLQSSLTLRGRYGRRTLLFCCFFLWGLWRFTAITA